MSNDTYICDVSSTFLGLDDNDISWYDTHYSVNGEYLTRDEVAQLIQNEM